MSDSGSPRWQNAWIIGASTGIGRALAKRIAGDCGSIAVSARSADKLEALAADYDQMLAAPLDVTDADAAQRLAHRLGDMTPLDLVVISSGAWLPVKPTELDPAAFREAVDVNFMGVINVLSAVIPAMVEHRGGHIAIMASVSGYRGLPNAAAYSPMKAALINLAESIRPQLMRKGVHVTIVNPGFVNTSMTSVNKFPMPFLMSAETAADRIAKGLNSRRYEIAFPNRFVMILKFLRILPNPVFFWIVNKFVLK